MKIISKFNFLFNKICLIDQLFIKINYYTKLSKIFFERSYKFVQMTNYLFAVYRKLYENSSSFFRKSYKLLKFRGNLSKLIDR